MRTRIPTHRSVERPHATLAALLAGVAFVLAPWVARAAPQDWVVQGTITERSGAVFDAGCLPSAQVGASFRLDYQFEGVVFDLNPLPTRGAYASVDAWRFVTADVNEAAVGNAGGVEVFNDDPVASNFADRYAVDYLNLQSWPAPCAAAAFSLVLTLYEEAASPPAIFASDAQPVTPPDPGAFSTTNSVVLGADGSTLAMTIDRIDVLGTLDAPVLPIATTTLAGGAERWFFDTPCTVACWIDPPIADGFDYEASGGARFTAIDDFPTGFDAPFDVWVEGDLVGQFGPGDSVDFTTWPGGGVTHFSVRGISPSVDTADLLAFPLRLTLDTTPAQFTMTSVGGAPVVPVLPGAGAAALAALLGATGLGMARRRRG